MKLRIAVADDIKSDTQRLVSALDEAARGICEIEFKCFENGDALLCDDGKYDAVFLDICMGSSNGRSAGNRFWRAFCALALTMFTRSPQGRTS